MNIFKRAWIKVDDFLERIFSSVMLNVFNKDVRTAEEVANELAEMANLFPRLKEGKVCKGGRNKPPTGERPQRPTPSKRLPVPSTESLSMIIKKAQAVIDEMPDDDKLLEKVKAKFKENYTGINKYPPIEVVDSIFYGFSSEKSKVYHVLGVFDSELIASSRCKRVRIDINEAIIKNPTDKRICKLCVGGYRQ